MSSSDKQRSDLPFPFFDQLSGAYARVSFPWLRFFADYLRQNPLLVAFALGAVISRLVFWQYTGRIWEDSLIALSSARNVWLGVGLTHHASEPHIQSFTSPLAEIIMIIGEYSGNGLIAVRLASILASVIAIFYCYQIGRLIKLRWMGHTVVLSYLAFDHLQVFFGMAGMESQIATALCFSVSYYFLLLKWLRLGVAIGLSALCRPELLILISFIIVVIALWHPFNLLKTLPSALIVVGPWVLFSINYFGSPIPHTIIVKSSTTVVSFDVNLLLEYIVSSWKTFAPFRQFWVVADSPVPDFVLVGVVLSLLLISFFGMISSLRIDLRFGAIALAVITFWIYRVMYRVNPYFMWYLPPFTALIFLFCAIGVDRLEKNCKIKHAAPIVALLFFFIYSSHFPFTLPLDRLVAEKIERDVRSRVGIELNTRMEANDSVVLEAVGFIGWQLPNKTTYDFPGLTSEKAFGAYKRFHHMAGLIESLKPTFIVVRPTEWEEFIRRSPDGARSYSHVMTVSADPTLDLSNLGLRYYAIDQRFDIFKSTN